MKINVVKQRCANTGVIVNVIILLYIYDIHFIHIDYIMQYNYEKIFDGKARKNYIM